MRYVVAATLALSAAVIAQSPPQEFEVAVIKRNISADSSSGGRFGANGQEDLINVSARTLITRAYPSRGSSTIVGLPAWTESERYDATVKADRRRPREESVPMWRALLADRMKLTAHYEPREEMTFDLVFARPDHRLGPQLKPTTCARLNQAAAPSGDRKPCGFSVGPNRLSIGPTTIVALARSLQLQTEALVVDKTGLEGEFDVELTFSPQELGATGAAATPSDAPDFFTAVQEQLGLKLAPSSSQVEVLVIDHVERPSEN
jgi:uncharacterized protein (TIGR03435 family)